MRLLVVTPFLPHPRADHGGGVLLWTLLDALRAEAEVTLLSFCHAGEPTRADVDRLVRRAVLVPRERNEDRTALGLWWNRGLLAWRIASRRLPLQPAKFFSARFARTLRDLLREERPDALLFEYGVSAQYLTLCRGVPSILTDYEAGSRDSSRSPWPALDGALRRAYVRRFYRRASLLQTLCEPDAAEIRQELGEEGPVVEVRPPALSLPDRSCRPERAPPAIAFYGNYAHPPNRQAALRLAHEILPRLRARVPDVRLLLAGAAATHEIARLGVLEGVRFEGFVADLADLLDRARLVLVPVLEGTGVRIKVLTAMAQGLPVVSTPLGARGLEGAPPLGLRIGLDPESLAEAAVAFLSDPDLAGRGGQEVRRWVGSYASPARAAAVQRERIADLVARSRSTGVGSVA